MHGFCTRWYDMQTRSFVRRNPPECKARNTQTMSNPKPNNSTAAVFVGFSLFLMRRYIEKSALTEEAAENRKSHRHANIRILTPVVCAVLAMSLSFADTTLSVLLFTLLIIFNLTPKGADIVDRMISRKKN